MSLSLSADDTSGSITDTRSEGGGYAVKNISLGLVIFFGLLILYVATGNLNRDAQSPDPVAAALPAWHFSLAHSLYLDRVAFPNIWLAPHHNHLVSNRQPGIVFFAVPFYWLLDHTPTFSMFPADVAAATASAGAVALLVVALRGLVGTRLALIAGAVVAFGTSTWSVSADTLWPHGPDQLFLAAAMLFLARKKPLLASLAIALAVPIRAHLAVMALVAGVWYAVKRRSVKPLLTFGLPSGMAIAGVLVYNHWLFGAWSLNGGYSPYVTANVTALGNGLNKASLPTNILGSLVSLDRGLVIWAPVVVVLTLALRPAWRKAPDWVRISSIGGLLYFLIQMKMNYFSGGDRFWSYRLTIEPLTLNVPLLALAARELIAHRPRLTRVAAAAALYGVGTQAIGAIFYSPPNLAYNSWTHSKLWEQLRYGGPGPLTVGLITLVCMIAALGWPRRNSDKADPSIPVQASVEPAVPANSATYA